MQHPPFPGQIPAQMPPHAPFPIPGQAYPPPGAPLVPGAPYAMIPPGAPPGLPQRPVFGDHMQMPPLHTGGPPGVSNGLPDAIDDLIASVSHEAPKTEVAPEKKGSKKEKDKNMRMVYSDNDISPEEKMAQLSRYAFVRG
jgi:hypothetical protein